MTGRRWLAVLCLATACRGAAPSSRPVAVELDAPPMELPRATFAYVQIEQLEQRARAHGFGIAGAVTAATAGSRPALDSVLAAALWIDADSADPIPAYPMLLQGLLETVGDAQFNLALLRLPSAARFHALKQLRSAALMRREQYTLVWMLDSSVARSPHRPNPQLPVADSTTVDRRPEIIRGSCSPPHYPEKLMRRGWNGRVVVDFVVDANGIPERRTIRAVATTHPGFTHEAVQVALSCRYRPGMIRQKPVRVRVQQPINFVFGRRGL